MRLKHIPGPYTEHVQKKVFLKTVLLCPVQIDRGHVSFLSKIRGKISKKKVFLKKIG